MKNGIPAVLRALLMLVLSFPLLAAPGDFDTTFADTGKLRTGLGGGPELVRAMVRQGDGKLVVAGGALSPNSDSAIILARYSAAGVLDPAFGTGGIVQTFMTPGFTATSLLLLSDGKFLVAGMGDAPLAASEIALVRYLANGGLDTAFGTGGVVRHDRPVLRVMKEVGVKMALTSTGKIMLCAGGVVMRLDANGALDPSFSGDGKAQHPLNSSVSGSTLLLLDNNRTLVAFLGTVNSTGKFFTDLVCYTSNGSTDASFGSNGLVTAPVPTFGLTLQANSVDDQRIVGVGMEEGTQTESFAVYRLDGVSGALDNTFGAAGKVSFPNSRGADVKIQRTTGGQPSRIVACGSYGSDAFMTVRLQLNGTPDTAFDGDGIALTDLVVDAGESSLALLVQPDNRIVVAGDSDGDFALVRYNTSGTLDTSFNGDGKRTEDISDYRFSGASSVFPQPDGKILVAGNYSLGRFLANGLPDLSFGGDGRVRNHFEIEAATQQTDGKVVTAGYKSSGLWQVARFLGDGLPDLTFDGDGKVSFTVSTTGSSVIPTAVAVQPGGEIVVGGGIPGAGGKTDFLMVRVLPNGAVDSSFDFDGRITTDFNAGDDWVETLDVDAAGRILAAGFMYNGSNRDFAVARYNPDGSPDPSFSFDGKTSIPVSASGDDRVRSIAFSGGKIILAGTAGGDAGVVRLLADGSLDTSFDTDGKVVVPFGPANDFGNAVAVDAAGRILLAGFRGTTGSNGDLALVRLLANGTVDSGHGSAGFVFVSFVPNTQQELRAVAVDSLGRTVAAGISDNRVALIRTTGDPFGQITSVTKIPANGHLLLKGNAAPGYTHTLQQSTALAAASFQAIGLIVPDAFGNWQQEVTAAGNRGFFRLLVPQP